MVIFISTYPIPIGYFVGEEKFYMAKWVIFSSVLKVIIALLLLFFPSIMKHFQISLS